MTKKFHWSGQELEENGNQTEEGEGKEFKFGFRLSKEDKIDLDEVANKLAMGNKTNFIIGAIRKFKDHPEQWNIMGDSVIENLVTKEELKQTKEEILQKQEETIESLLKTQEAINQMQYLIAHQKENSHKADLLEDIKSGILNYENRKELETYKKVEEFLVQKFPDEEQWIVEEKIYNEIILELMQEGFLEYKVRSRTLKWK